MTRPHVRVCVIGLMLLAVLLGTWLLRAAHWPGSGVALRAAAQTEPPSGSLTTPAEPLSYRGPYEVTPPPRASVDANFTQPEHSKGASHFLPAKPEVGMLDAEAQPLGPNDASPASPRMDGAASSPGLPR
jgi:hypothetical protein